jgi:hypothetical protein
MTAKSPAQPKILRYFKPAPIRADGRHSPKPMSANKTVRPCSCPAGDQAGPKPSPLGGFGSHIGPTYGSGASGQGDFKIEALKAAAATELRTAVRLIGDQLRKRTGAIGALAFLSGPIQTALPLQRVLYGVCRVQRVANECVSFADTLSVSKLTRPLRF